MSRWIKIVGLVLAANAGFGQTTWQGLSFGWRLSQVRETLLKKGFHLVRLEGTSARFNPGPGQQEWDVQPVFDLQLSSIRPTLHFTPNVMFDPTDKLGRVTLILATKQHNTEGIETAALTVLVAGPVQQELTAKYGAPVSKTGVCDSVSSHDLIGGSGQVECEAMWRLEGQNITLKWLYLENPAVLSFAISYKPISSAL